MKHTLSVLLLGAAVAVTAHVAWFQLHRPCSGRELDCQLAWIKSELRLTDGQFAQIKAVHEASSPRLLVLAAEVARMRDEYAAFERTRLATDRVDFIEFAHFVEQRRAIDRECLASTRRLVSAASDVMTPLQRERYLNLIAPTLKDPNGSVSN
jgi:capsule polysaccharide export protein KpsE/RkpR